MSEEILKTIMKLFAIVAKERITEAERNNIREFLSQNLNRELVDHYLELFEIYVKEYKVDVPEKTRESLSVDDATLEFIDEWNNIIKIAKEVNQALTITQKLFMVIKIIELVYNDGEISERQGNLIFYLGESLKIPQKQINCIKMFVSGQDYEELSTPDTLIIDDGSGDYDFKGPNMKIKNLTGLVAILRIPEQELYFIKYLGITLLNINGVPLKSRKIRILPAGSTIRGTNVPTVYYSDIVSRFLQNTEKQDVSFITEHIFFHFKSGKAGVQNVNIAEQGGKLIGIMGASGSGKSTLLNVLNGIEKPSSGRVLINSVDIHEEPENIQGVIGYVPQDDYLIAELSVFENLYYAAKLCFRNHSEENIIDLVENILSNLGLSETRDLKVGSPMDKTISGGQRKRLNIGLELMREPQVLFVDEPTSGLSSRDSENIMDLLKELSFRGKMVFVVIHQPSSDIFKMFDTLIIMDVGGYQIFYGNPVESVSYFRSIINAADKDQVACRECGNINSEQVFNIIETKIINEFGKHTNARKISPQQWYQYFHDNIKIRKIHPAQKTLKPASEIPGRLKQVVTFFVRDVKTKISNNQYMAINFLQAPVLAIFIGFMVRYFDIFSGENANYSFHHNDNIPVYFFMSIIVALFMGLIVSSEEIFRDRMMLKRERFLNLSKLSYLSSKITVLFIISAIQTASFVVIGNLILDIQGTEPAFWMIMFSSSCFANMLGLNISATFNSAVTIYIIIPLLLIPQLLLSGVVIPFYKFNPYVTSIESVPLFGDFMASRWAFEASMVSQYKNTPYGEYFYETDKQMADAEYMQVYYLPAIETELEFCFQNLSNKSIPGITEKMKNSLSLVNNELQLQFVEHNKEIPEWVNKLNSDQFTLMVYEEAKHFIDILKKVNNERSKKAENERKQLIEQWGENNISYDSMRLVYYNNEIGDWVKNTKAIDRIIKSDIKFIRKYTPIYNTSHIDHSWNYRADFYTPVKQIFGKKLDTLYFNVLIIWIMSIALFFALYFDLFKGLVNLVESRKKKRKRNRNFI